VIDVIKDSFGDEYPRIEKLGMGWFKNARDSLTKKEKERERESG